MFTYKFKCFKRVLTAPKHFLRLTPVDRKKLFTLDFDLPFDSTCLVVFSDDIKRIVQKYS